MKDIIITQTEHEQLHHVKNLKELVFYYYKYHCNITEEDREILNRFNSWDELVKASKKIHVKKSNKTSQKSVTPTSNDNFGLNKKCESLKGEFDEKLYRPIHRKISYIKSHFNTDGNIDFTNYEEVLFWYKLILRMNDKKKTWDQIIYATNYDQMGFVEKYSNMCSISDKEEFINEIDYFIDNYTNMLSTKRDDGSHVECYNNMMKVTNRDVLEILLAFDKIDVKKSINDLKVLSATDLVNSHSYRETSREYVEYLTRITTEIAAAVEKVNQEFSHINTFISFKDFSENNSRVISINNYENLTNQDADAFDNIYIVYLINALQSYDYNYYKTLSPNNYEAFMIDEQPDLSQSENQKRHNKIRDDLIHIIENSPKLQKMIFNNPAIFWDLDIVAY